MLEIPAFASGAEFRDYFKANYGPTIVTYRHIAEDADRVAELDAALADLGDGALKGSPPLRESSVAAGGAPPMSWEYLLVVADRSDRPTSRSET